MRRYVFTKSFKYTNKSPAYKVLDLQSLESTIEYLSILELEEKYPGIEYLVSYKEVDKLRESQLDNPYSVYNISNINNI